MYSIIVNKDAIILKKCLNSQNKNTNNNKRVIKKMYKKCINSVIGDVFSVLRCQVWDCGS